MTLTDEQIEEIKAQDDRSAAQRELAALKAENESLREALRPFSEYMKDGMDRDFDGNPLPDDSGVGWVYLTIGDFRRAAALKENSHD